MLDQVIEQKRIIKRTCSKAAKNRGPCDFGFTTLQAACVNCRWLDQKVVKVGERELGRVALNAQRIPIELIPTDFAPPANGTAGPPLVAPSHSSSEGGK